MRKTLKRPARISGYGLHTGQPSHLRLRPAPSGTGIVFVRIDIEGMPVVPARWDLVQANPLRTELVSDAGVRVATIEHLMAALAVLGVTDLLIEISGPEVPIMDGSAHPFVERIERTGLIEISGSQPVLEILRPVELRVGEAWARLEPHPGFALDFTIEFSDGAIGKQSRRVEGKGAALQSMLTDSRTFCRLGDVEAMRARGLALGGTFENAVVFDGDRVLSPGGLRHADEPVRHKMLDAIGDLALAGATIQGVYIGHRAGHSLTNGLLRRLFAQTDAWQIRAAEKREAIAA